MKQPPQYFDMPSGLFCCYSIDYQLVIKIKEVADLKGYYIRVRRTLTSASRSLI
jgi:hypothetical protein